MGRILFLTVVCAWPLIMSAPTTDHRQLSGQDSFPVQECANKPTDIYFLLDCSSSVWIVDYDKQLEFVVSLVNHFHIDPNASRVGLGIFSDDFRPVIDIGGYPDKDTLIRAIRATPYLSGNTYTDKGLHGMRTHGFRPDVVRTGATKVGVVIVGRRSRHRSNTAAEATAAQEENIWLFAIGVGDNVDREELSTIASQPKEQFVFHVASFHILATLAHTLAISTCSLHQPHADSASCRRSKNTDIIFLYDAAAMRSGDTGKVREFTRRIVSEFSMVSGNFKVGIISQGCVGEDIYLSQYPQRDDILNALKDQPQPSLSPLLRKLRLQGYDTAHGGRPYATKMAVVFVDDVIVSRDDVLYEALLLGFDDVMIHVIAIGSHNNINEIQQLTGSKEHITQVDSYDALLHDSTIQLFLDKICERKPSSIRISNSTISSQQTSTPSPLMSSLIMTSSALTSFFASATSSQIPNVSLRGTWLASPAPVRLQAWKSLTAYSTSPPASTSFSPAVRSYSTEVRSSNTLKPAAYTAAMSLAGDSLPSVARSGMDVLRPPVGLACLIAVHFILFSPFKLF